MKVIKPTPITSAMLVSTTATETVAAWNAGTAYIVGDQALRTSTQRIYYRLIAGTTAIAPELDAANWVDVAPSNTMAMFDGEISTPTAHATALTVVVKPGLCNSIAFFGLEGSAISITVRDALAGAVVYQVSRTLDGSVISDWYQYYFEAGVQLAEVVLTNLPPYGDAHITVTITSGGTAKCGAMLVGTVYALGDTLGSPTASIVDYSKKDTDAFGVTTFVKRAYSKRVGAKFMLPNPQLNKVQRVLADLRATPCAWIGSETPGFEPLTLYGFYRDFSIDVAYPDLSFCSLEIEGLT